MEIIEHWRDVPNYEGLYRVSDLGRIKSLKFGKDKILKSKCGSSGYLQVVLYKEGEKKYFLVHRLVMLVFIGESDLQVNHKNGIKADNKLENLEYCTGSQNQIHAFNTGLNVPVKGEKHGRSKLTIACAERIKYGHQGMTQKEIAKLYGVTSTLVSLIRLGKT